MGHHLHLVGLTSCGASFFFALLVLRLVGETYGPRVDRVGDGEVDVLVFFLPVLRVPFRWALPLLRACLSTELSLSDIAAIALSSSLVNSLLLVSLSSVPATSLLNSSMLLPVLRRFN